MTTKIETLEVESRSERGTRPCRRLRRRGLVPLNLICPGRPSEPLQAATRQVQRLVDAGAHLVELQLGGQLRKALLKEVRFDPIRGDVLHADFLEVRLDQEISVEVEVVLKGKPVGVAEEGGVLVPYARHVEVVCLATAIPGRLEVDVTPLKIGQTLHGADLPLPEGVRLSRPETAIAGVEAPAAAEPAPAEAAPAAELGPAQPELIRKPRKTEEGEEGA